jgi:hypothetical protein
MLPQLGREASVVGTEWEVGLALRHWLAPLSFDGSLEICIDYSTDWKRCVASYCCVDNCDMPAWISGRHINREIDVADAERYWRQNGRRAHYALHDQKANRFAFQIHAAMEFSEGSDVERFIPRTGASQ